MAKVKKPLFIVMEKQSLRKNAKDGAAKDKHDGPKVHTLLEPFEFALPEYAKEPEDAEAEKALKKADSFLSSHKVTLALIVTIATIVLLSGMYLFHQGQLWFFHVDDAWNTYVDKAKLYKLILPICVISLSLVFLLLEVDDIVGNWSYSVERAKVSFRKVREIAKQKMNWKKKAKPVIKFNKNGGLITYIVVAILFIVSIFLLLPHLQVDNSQPSNVSTEKMKLSVLFVFLCSILVETVGIGIRTLDRKFFIPLYPYRFKNTNLFRSIIFRSINGIAVLAGIAGLGVSIFAVGVLYGMMKRNYPIMCLTESIPPLPSEQIQSVNILFPVTTTATTSTTAFGTTTTDTVTTDTTTTTEATAPADMPDDVPVYVILAENKDNYLAAAGIVRQGGRLDLDRDCQIILEKKNQVVLKKTFTEVNVDYNFDYIFEKEEEQP